MPRFALGNHWPACLNNFPSAHDSYCVRRIRECWSFAIKFVSFDTEITSDTTEVTELARRTSDMEVHGSPAVTSRIFGDVLEVVADSACILERLWLGMYRVWYRKYKVGRGNIGSRALLLSTLDRPQIVHLLGMIYWKRPSDVG